MNPRIVGISGPAAGSVFPLGPFDLIIGKGKKCSVRLNDPLLSLKHCGIARYEANSIVWDMQSATGTFVNGFHFCGKFLLEDDRLRLGGSIFVHLTRPDAEVDPAILKRTPQEEEWDRWLDSRQQRQRPAYEPEMWVVLEAILAFNTKINTLRDADEIQSCVFELIFRLMPVEGVALLLADGNDAGVLSTSYRRLGASADEPFPLDDAVTQKALHDGAPVYGDKVVCFPLRTPNSKVGLLYAVMAAKGSEWFTGGHMKLLQAVAGSTAVALENLRHVAWLEGENRRLTEVINVEHGMIGRSAKMQEVYRIVSRAGPSDLNVLITGESGTGKELVARAIHLSSSRSQNVMHTVNCAAFTDTLLGSELFGHEKGAFTGADKQHIGLFESAGGGAVFLDEVGECDLKLQADLLRLIQHKEFKRLGSNKVLHADVRLIAATNVDLEKAMKEGRFRQDLFFRLNVIRILVPRLAERREDIPPLAAEFIKKHGHIRPAGYERVKGLTPEVRQVFATYDWPGNVRELENVIERAIALGTSAYIRSEELPPLVNGDTSQPSEIGQWAIEVESFKRALIEKALIETDGNFTAAGRLLGLNPTYFLSVCNKLHIKAHEIAPKSRKRRSSAR